MHLHTKRVMSFVPKLRKIYKTENGDEREIIQKKEVSKFQPIFKVLYQVLLLFQANFYC